MSAATGGAMASGAGAARPLRRHPEAGPSNQGDGKCLMSSKIIYFYIKINKTFEQIDRKR